MKLLVAGPREVDSALLLESFRSYSIDATWLTLEGDVEQLPRGPFDVATLVWPRVGVVALGERIAQLRDLLGSVELSVCSQRPTNDERILLRQCGATEVFTPRHWAPAAVGERILAQLISTDHVSPRSLGEIQGGTEKMHDVFKEIETFAMLSDPVLVVGETGTGKELVARELHRLSKRPGELVAINCATLSTELLGTELFGHARGAFTGAVSTRTGLLVSAGSGSVFLDELPDLTLGAQAELLRVIEERRVRAVGDNRWQTVRARLILGANQSLHQASDEGRFRQDLLERIQGFSIVLPPLRERRADIPALAQHFLLEYDREYSCRHRIPSGALDGLFRHHWPGNVRELRQAIRVAAARAPREGDLNPLHIDQVLQRRGPGPAKPQQPLNSITEPWRSVLERTRRSYFQAVIEASGGNRDLAAKRAGISRSQLYEILKQIAETPPDEG